jgi:hypothetical protein
MELEASRLILSRRGALWLVAGGGLAAGSRLYGSNPDFWNKKEPSEWTREEIERLTEKSPWAKEVSVQRPVQEGGRDAGQTGGGTGWPGGGGTGSPRVGGLGIPGIGGMGGGRRRGGPGKQTLQGIVRWESAKPVLEALKTPLPESFANRYVISVNGFPLDPDRYRRPDEESGSDSTQASETTLDRLKQVTFLEPKGRPDAQPGVIVQQPSAGGTSVLFGFSRELVALKLDYQEVTFRTRFGSLSIKAKFVLKDMLYRGELAL